MSFIKKIVEIVEKNEDVDARKNIESMKKDVKLYQEKVKTYIDHNYVEFLSDVANNGMYLEQGDQLKARITDLQENMVNETRNTMYSAQNEVSKFIDELEEISKSLEISVKLMKIDQFLEQIDKLNQSESYSEINNMLTSIDLILKDPENKIIRKLDMYSNLKLRLGEEYQNMLLNLENRLDAYVSMNEKTFHSTKAITISISKNKEIIKETVETLYDAEFDLQKYTDFLMENVFEPSIKKPVSLEVLESDKEYLLNLSYTTKQITEDIRPNYKTVFSNMKHLLYFLVNMNVLVNGQVHFLALLFQDAKEQLIDLLINECIVHSIPGTIEERNDSTIKEDISKICKLFNDTHFIEDQEDGKLSEFAKKVDDHFQNRFSQNILDKSSEIMKRDLHDMVLVPENVTSSSPAAFARCMISKSTQDIIVLMEKVLKEANSSPSAPMAESLRASVDSVLQNYSFIIQQHHSKFLSKIPQQTALFYNNCLYLAFWVGNNELVDGNKFDVLAKTLIKEGSDIFESQMDKQKIALCDLLTEIDLSATLTSLSSEHFKPVKQCLRQMELLKNVWQTILPTDLYNRNMGKLLDVLCSDLVRKICSMEDISSTLCTSLVDLIKIIVQKGPTLFEDESVVPENVANWQKMIDLQFVLDTSLVEITEQWKSGKLSQSFKAEEIKHLIRALFQNTDRRANALSAIV